jgi:phage host-nuclease inhibitor protein Gam
MDANRKEAAMNRLKDLRSSITSLEGSKTAFSVLAQLELSLAKSDAQFEARMAKLKAEHEAKNLPDAQRRRRAAADLTAYIESHPDEFKKPRKVKTEMGVFGLEKATGVEIEDEEKVIALLMERGCDDCIKIKRTVIKDALKTRMTPGQTATGEPVPAETFPGCRVKSGDTAVYNVAKVLLDAAKVVEE